MKIKLLPSNDLYVYSINDLLNKVVRCDSGQEAICIKVIDDKTLLLLNAYSIFQETLSVIIAVYQDPPKFIFGDVVASTNGTPVVGLVKKLQYHFKDEQFKYHIEELDGKLLKRRYHENDLQKVE